jgi:hypothetical protein
VSDDDGYVHRPGSDDGDPTPSGFGPRGWLLVASVVLATLVVPGVIYLFPATPGAAGLPFLVAMLALPLVPALLLGATAVWSMTAATAGADADGTPGDDARADAGDDARADETDGVESVE